MVGILTAPLEMKKQERGDLSWPLFLELSLRVQFISPFPSL